jgi:hypothetical protein
MATITRSTSASLDSAGGMFVIQRSGNIYAGEALDLVSACRIHTDGLIYMADGSAADAEARFIGMTPKSYLSGEAVTLYGIGARFRYATGMTPGARLFLSATDGRLDDAATTGGTLCIAIALNATDIEIVGYQLTA